jgi:hypothetical protein
MTQFILNETPRGRTRDGAKLVPVKPPKPKRTRRKFNVGDVVTYRTQSGKCQYVKVTTGQTRFHLNWKPVAVVAWEKHIGPVPAGKVIYHLNGDPFDHRIENLAAGTFSDRARNWIRNNPEENNAKLARMIVGAKRARKARTLGSHVLGFVPTYWYAVDHAAKTIINVPCRDKWRVYVAAGIDEATLRANYLVNHDGHVATALGWPGLTDTQACILTAMLGRDWSHWQDVWCDVEAIALPRIGRTPQNVTGRWWGFDQLARKGLLERVRSVKRVRWRARPGVEGQRRSWTNCVPVKGKDAARLVGFRRIDPVYGDVTEPTESVLWRVLRTVRAEARANKEKP